MIASSVRGLHLPVYPIDCRNTFRVNRLVFVVEIILIIGVITCSSLSLPFEIKIYVAVPGTVALLVSGLFWKCVRIKPKESVVQELKSGNGLSDKFNATLRAAGLDVTRQLPYGLVKQPSKENEETIFFVASKLTVTYVHGRDRLRFEPPLDGGSSALKVIVNTRRLLAAIERLKPIAISENR